jgi:hypothetical protein
LFGLKRRGVIKKWTDKHKKLVKGTLKKKDVYLPPKKSDANFFEGNFYFFASLSLTVKGVGLKEIFVR